MKTLPKKPNMIASPSRKKGFNAQTFNFGDFDPSTANHKKLSDQSPTVNNENLIKYQSPNMKNYDTFSPFRSDDNTQSPPGFGARGVTQQPQTQPQNNNLDAVQADDQDNFKQIDMM